MHVLSKIEKQITLLREFVASPLPATPHALLPPRILGGSTRSKASNRKSNRSAHRDIAAKATQLEVEFIFLDVEREKSSELKRVSLLKELASTQAQIEAVARAEPDDGTPLYVDLTHPPTVQVINARDQNLHR